VTATVEVDGTAPKQRHPATIQLNPHQTRVLDILRDLVGRENGGTIQKEGGISITHSGAPGAILARMLVSRESTGYSSVINFTDPTAPRSSKLHGGGLRLGSIGNDELTPIIVARNIGGEPTTVSGRVPYTNESGDVVFVTIPDVNIAAGKIKQINVERAVRQANVPPSVTFAGIELEYTTAPGSVIMSAQSVSRSERQVFQVPLLDPNRMPSSAGGFPWKADGDYTTVVFIKNETATPKKYLARLFYEGGDYALKPREVKPGQTVMLDFKQMRDEQTPDSMGKPIPLNVERGQIGWSMVGADNNTMSGRSEQVNTTLGVSSTYACYNCCPDSIIESQPSPFSLSFDVGGQNQFGFRATVRNCYLSRTFFEFVGFDWSSSNLSVGEISNSGWATAIDGGNASMTGYFEEVVWENNGSHCVNQPNTVSGSSEMEVNCAYPVNFRQVGDGEDIGGGTLRFNYQWDSNTGNLQHLSRCFVGEIVTYPGTNDPYSPPSPPFPDVARFDNPTIVDVQATAGALYDSHRIQGTFVRPFSSSSFTATQYYRYKCPCLNRGNYVNLTGPISITRSVFEVPFLGWGFGVSKSNASAKLLLGQ
jgi:hypothetical protein